MVKQTNDDMKKTVQIIGRGYKNAIQEALNLFVVKHRFLLDVRKYSDNDWKRVSNLIKKYPPKLIIIDNDYSTKANAIELIY